MLSLRTYAQCAAGTHHISMRYSYLDELFAVQLEHAQVDLLGKGLQQGVAQVVEEADLVAELLESVFLLSKETCSVCLDVQMCGLKFAHLLYLVTPTKSQMSVIFPL